MARNYFVSVYRTLQGDPRPPELPTLGTAGLDPHARDNALYPSCTVPGVTSSIPKSKQEIVDEIHRILGLPSELLGPGSKERKETLELVASSIQLPSDISVSKTDLAQQIAAHLGVVWDTTCFSSGDTITTEGLGRILTGLITRSTDVYLNTSVESGGPEFGSEEEHDDRVGLEFAIAEQISALSNADRTPSEFEPCPRTISLDEIDFKSNSWMIALEAVQGWLRFDSPLNTNSPLHFLATLIDNLGMESSSAEAQWVLQSGRLDIVHLEKLAAWMDRAVTAYEEFVELLEEGQSRAVATATWVTYWEEYEEEEETGSVSAKARTEVIKWFGDHAERGRINLSPSYQRGDVWPIKDAQLLIESILRGIPLPSLILLQAGDVDGNHPISFEVVDGRQRLTAILRFIGRHPKALETIKEAALRHSQPALLDLFKNDYKAFRRLWKNATGETLTVGREKEYCFPFKLRKGGTTLGKQLVALEGKYYTQIRDAMVPSNVGPIEVSEFFEGSVYDLPVITYERATTRQIHEVFKLYNKQGKHLNAEEIRNAVFHNLDIMRGLLVLSGDNVDVDNVAPFLKSKWSNMMDVGELLSDYGAGVLRYRRTKLLSWLTSSLLFDTFDDQSGRVKIRSTTGHINEFLSSIEANTRSLLRQSDVIVDWFELLRRAIEAHSSVEEAWPAKFRGGDNGKWQELELIATLVGLAMVAVVTPESDLASLVVDNAQSLRDGCGTKAWKRPKKSQSKDQWEYIGRVAIGVTQALGVNPDQVDQELRHRFGSSGVKTLTRLSLASFD